MMRKSTSKVATMPKRCFPNLLAVSIEASGPTIGIDEVTETFFPGSSVFSLTLPILTTGGGILPKSTGIVRGSQIEKSIGTGIVGVNNASELAGPDGGTSVN